MKNVKPIHTAKDHKAALAEIERLWDAEPGTADADRLEVLGVLVEAYERKHHPILPPDPIEAIKFRLEQSGLKRTALEPIIGSRGRVSEILNRQRALTVKMIRALARTFEIPADALISETLRPTKRPVVTDEKAAKRAGSKRPAPKRAGVRV